MEKIKLNPTITYVLSILAFLCCCVGGIGVIPAGIAYFMANGKLKEAALNPEGYENTKAMKTAKTIALVVLILNLLYLTYTIYTIYTVGWDEMMEQSRMKMEEMGIEQP